MSEYANKSACCNADMEEDRDKYHTRFICRTCRRYCDSIKNTQPLVWHIDKWLTPQEWDAIKAEPKKRNFSDPDKKKVKRVRKAFNDILFSKKRHEDSDDSIANLA